MTEPNFQVVIIPVTLYQQNCSLVWSTASMAGAVVDPGGDVELIEEAIRKNDVKVHKIVLTHGHVDHAAGAKALAERLSVPVVGPHKDDQFLLDELAAYGLQLGIKDAQNVTPDEYLDEGDAVDIGGIEFAVRHIPGHTPGHIVLISEENDFAIVGDVVFENSVGRTDFKPYGNTQQLMDGIAEKLLPLKDSVMLLPGHGNVTSIGAERRNNPFLIKLNKRQAG